MAVVTGKAARGELSSDIVTGDCVGFAANVGLEAVALFPENLVN